MGNKSSVQNGITVNSLDLIKLLNKLTYENIRVWLKSTIVKCNYDYDQISVLNYNQNSWQFSRASIGFHLGLKSLNANCQIMCTEHQYNSLSLIIGHLNNGELIDEFYSIFNTIMHQ